MRSEVEYRRALALLADGLTPTQVSRLTGIPRSTISGWRHGRSPADRDHSNAAGVPCPGCEAPISDDRAYAYLLGAYLGDGSISAHPRGVFRLRITCDVKYPGIIAEIAACMATIRRSDRIGFNHQVGCLDVNNYWKHWPCVFPQHSSGRKHERAIALAPWQQRIVDAHPRALLRGLIHSDGNRHINEVERRLKDGPRRYRYVRYMFTNASADILGICTDALDSIGISWTRTDQRNISVARRADVAELDRFIGPKV